jgi:hypothetical protein
MIEDLRAAPTAAVTITDARLLAMEQLLARGVLSGASLERVSALLERFEAFAWAFAGALLVSDVTPEIVAAFVRARTSRGQPASASTQRLRRWALDRMFQVWRELRLIGFDPLLDLHRPARFTRACRPLTDEELERCRWASQATLTATRQPLALALAEVGLWPVEIPSAALEAVGERVVARTQGAANTRARTIPLTKWGAAQVRRQFPEGVSGRPILGGQASPASARTSIAQALRDVMRRAGVRGADVSLTSLIGWAGMQTFKRTGRIEDVARVLGLSSLDRAARLIGHDWRRG